MTALRQQLKVLIIDTLSLRGTTPEDIDDEAPLFGEADGLGLDSLDALELVVALEYEFGLHKKLDAEESRAVFRSVATLADFVAAERTR